jgi:hypothetical protein
MRETTPVAWPPGWYHDPAGGELLRWWDGTSWADRTVSPEKLPIAAGSAARPSRSHSPARGRGRLAVAAAVAVGLASVVLVLAHIAPGHVQRSSATRLTTTPYDQTPSPSERAALTVSTASRSPSAPVSPASAAASPTRSGAPAMGRTFADGTFLVPRGVSPGTYHTINRLDDCTWYRWARVGGTTSVVGQGIGDDGPAIATVLPGDVQFSSVGCGRWSSAPTGPTGSATPATPSMQLDQGTFRVGVDVSPGIYASAAPAGCIWRRLSAFTGDAKAVIAEGHPGHPTTVTILPTDLGFFTIHCAGWHRA